MHAEARDATDVPAPGHTRRWLPAAVVASAVALHLPSLATGFYADDHMHQLALDGRLPLRPWSLFDFGTTADWASLPDTIGGAPWWTSPDWMVRFFRPLASATMWLDHVLWGRNAVGWHATSLLWFAALLVAAYALFRALGLTRGVAAGAVALLGASQATVLPVAWIANRNTVLAAFFTTAAVAAMASHARLGRGRALAAALGLAAAACLSKESGVVAFALVALYCDSAGLARGARILRHPLCARAASSPFDWRASPALGAVTGPAALPRPFARRAAAVSCACAVVFAVTLVAAGFGTRSLFYATPWSDPLPFARNLGVLATVGLLAIATPIPSDIVFAAPEATVPLVAVAIVVVVPLALWMRRRLRDEPAAPLLVAWTLVSLVPEAGAPTSDRLLLTAGVGGAGLVALLLARTLPRAAGRPRGERAVAVALLVLVGPLEAAATCGGCAFFARSAASVRAAVLAADVGPPALGRREVLVLQSDDPLVPFSIGSTWAFWSKDADLWFSVLQMGGRGLRWTREDERTMVFESLGRPFVADPFEIVYRAHDATPREGTRIPTPAFDVEVVATAPGGGVRTVRLRWREPPDGERFRFLVPRDHRLTDVRPPPPGETVVLPEVAPANPFAR